MKKFLVAVLVSVSMVLSMIPVIAVDNTMTVIFTDVTATDTTVLEGETKIQVSVEGAPSNVAILQMYLDFSGDFSYKSIKYLYDTDDVTVVSPNAASSNAEGSVKLAMIDVSGGMDLSGTTDLFVLTFDGDAGDEMTLELNDLEDTYYVVGSINGSTVYPTATTSVTASGSTTSNEAVSAEVTLTMDKVTSFSAASSDGSYVGSGIELKITDESDTSNEYYTVLNNVSISKGGHRDATSTIPVFTVTTDLLAGHTYTVTLSGMGYITATQTGVTFEDAVEFTNDDFIPGDSVSNSVVDQDDYDYFMNVYENVSSNSSLESYATDFNRDGVTDVYDYNILLSVYTPSTDTDPTATPSATATTKPSSTSSSSSSSSSGGGGGGGGSSSSSTKATASPEPSTSPDASDTDTDTSNSSDTADSKYFTDLGDYSWAESAIYTLKEQGIINGTSDTTYSPANNIKRGDFIIILVNMLSIDDEYTENFTDVPEDSYYYDQIGKAKAAGVAQGYGDEFMPENSVTRQDLISLAYRAFLDAGYIEAVDDLSALDEFTDKDDVSDYAASAMAAMVQAGVIHGSDGQLNPKGNATRAETAVMCAALLELMD
ncbi:MAG: S-layer homology domain-containing protein [Firmicutes bacterium]|nr:S-layer homology domain-containing protein [Bacillota bacterium]